MSQKGKKAQKNDLPPEWLDRIEHEFDENEGVLIKTVANQSELQKVFGELKPRPEAPMYCKEFDVNYKNTACILRIIGPKLGGGWKLLLNKQINTKPNWEVKRKGSNASYNRRNEGAKILINTNVKNTVQEEEEEEDSERNKNRKSNINLSLNLWQNSSPSQKVLKAGPGNKILTFDEVDQFSNEDIFYFVNQWDKFAEETENKIESWCKKDFSGKKPPEIADCVISQNNIIRVLIRLIGGMAKKIEGVKKLEERNAKKSVQIQNVKNQINDRGRIISGRFNRSKAIAKKNIKKYKEENVWIDDKDWKKLSVYERIMKRWKFTDTHQCLTPWDEGKLSDQELKDFHDRKKSWRATRKEELVKNNKQNTWIMRRFEKFCHARIIGNRFWQGLDISYDDYLGIQHSYDNISWRIVRRRNFWRTWKPKFGNSIMNNNSANNINNINNINTDELQYWGSQKMDWEEGKNEN